MKLRLFLAAIFTALGLFICSCGSPAEQPELSLPAPSTAEEPELPKQSEPSEPTIYLSQLALELEHDILREVKAFDTKHLIPLDAELFATHIRFQFGRGGNVQIYQNIPFEGIHLARVHVEDATSLLTMGKLPGEVMPRDTADIKDEVGRLIQMAKSLFSQQLDVSFAYEKQITSFVKQPEPPDGWSKRYSWEEVSNEDTLSEIAEQYEKYRQDMSEIISHMDRFLSKLPKAQED